MLLTSLDSFVQLITALLIFVFVLVLTYFTTRFTAGFQKEKMRTSNIEVVDTVKMTNNKLIQIIRTGNHYYSVVTCKDTVTVLGEINPEELSETQKAQAKQMNFQDILEKAKNFKPKK